MTLRFWLATLLVIVGTGHDRAIVPPNGALSEDGIPASTKFAATMIVRSTPEARASLLVIDMLVPMDIAGRQKILELTYTPKPEIVYDKDGQRYAQFRFTDISKGAEVKVDLKVEAIRDDLETATARKPIKARVAEGNDLERWLVYERYLESTSPSILKVAERLKRKGVDDTLRATFDYVVAETATTSFIPEDRGALLTVYEKRGDCTDFADLFVALCRANKIPARFLEGYLLEAVPETPKHDWAEVYLEKLGWVPFDPRIAKTSKTTTFSVMRPIYLLLDHQRVNATLQSGHFWAYRFEGEGNPQLVGDFSSKKL